MGVFCAGCAADMRNFVLQKFETELAEWPESMDGLRILVLGDFHVRQCHIDTGSLDAVVTKTNRMNPDVILLLGDYVAGRTKYPELVSPECIAQSLGRLRARYGVFAIMGNHDAWFGRQRVALALRATPIRLLRDEVVTVTTPGGAFQLTGLDTPRRRNTKWSMPQIHGTTDGALPQILMVHNPASFPDIPLRYPLVIAAHTHGGQVRLPLFGDLVGFLYHPRFRGKNRHFSVDGDRKLFITSGLGTTRIHWRMNCPPEVVELVMKSPLRRGKTPSK